MLECTDRTIIICAQNYNLKSATLLSAGVPPWNSECSRPLKNECSSSPQNNRCSSSPQNNECACPQNNGCAPPFFKGVLHELILWDSFHIQMCSFISSLIECSLNDECSRPLKNRCSSSPPKIIGARRAPKIMGARAPIFSGEHFMNLFLSCPLCNCSLLVCLWTMSACAPLSGECSCPPRKLVLVEHS